MEENTQDILREGLDYTQNGKHLLTIGTVSPKLLKHFDIDQEVCYADFSWENLLKTLKNHTTVFTPLPKYPSVKRDLALLLDKKVSFKEVKEEEIAAGFFGVPGCCGFAAREEERQVVFFPVLFQVVFSD